MTCWRRLKAWQAAGVWGRLHRLLLAPFAVGRPHRLLAPRSPIPHSIRAVGAGENWTEPNLIAVNRARNTTFSPTRRAFR